jgi:hypothetical protein
MLKIGRTYQNLFEEFWIFDLNEDELGSLILNNHYGFQRKKKRLCRQRVQIPARKKKKNVEFQMGVRKKKEKKWVSVFLA